MKKELHVISSVDKRSKLFESQTAGLIALPEGMMRVSGVVAKMNVVNNNNRFYTKENYLPWVERLQYKINEGLYGELEHPQTFNINYNNVSHKIEKLWYDHATDEVKAIFLLLDTENGKKAQSIVKSGGALKCSSRASGTTMRDDRAVIDELFTIDLVGTPGFNEAKMYLLMESVQQQGAGKVIDGEYTIHDNGMCYTAVSRVRQVLNESLGNDDQQALYEALNLRTDRNFKKETNELFESIKNKVLNRV